MKSSAAISDTVCGQTGHKIQSLQETVLEDGKPATYSGSVLNKTIVICIQCGTSLEKIQKSRSSKKANGEGPTSIDEVK